MNKCKAIASHHKKSIDHQVVKLESNQILIIKSTKNIITVIV